MTAARTHGRTDARIALVLGLAVVLAAPLPAQQLAGAPPAPTPVVAIRNATIVPVVGPRIPNGTIVLRGGRIEAVGAGVSVPADALVVDGTGLFVYPGLIDSGTRLGLTEIGSVPGGEDTQELGNFNPHDDVLSAINPTSEIIPTVRVNGVTTVLTSARGGVIAGQAALVDLAGWTAQEMAILPRAGMVITFPRVRTGRRGGGEGGGQGAEAQAEEVSRQTRALREYLAGARAYADIKERLAGGATGTQETSLPMEAMVPVIRGESPVILDVETAEQIRGALAIVDSFHLKVIFRGARFAWQIADTLAARHIPVIVGPTVAAPDDRDPYDAIYAYPGVLARAGVKIAFQTDAGSDSRNLASNAGIATAYGLDPEEALRSITINAAQIWGVADRYGSLEAGKVANVIVTSGDVLDARTDIRYVFIRGQLQNRDDRNTRLYNQFHARPR